MKNLVTLLLLSVAAIAASAPVVRVDNTENAYLINADGSETNLGAVFDVIGNHAGNAELISAVQKGAREAVVKLKAEAAVSIKAAQDTAATQITAAQRASTDAIAANVAELTAAKKAVEDAVRELAALRAELAAAQAELAALRAAAASTPVPQSPPN